MDTIEHIKGKKFAVLGYDEAQKSLLKAWWASGPFGHFRYR
jgi:hypothetical protein